MQLSVVILNYNVKYFLQLCLDSVVAATAHLDAEIIVADNQSADGSCAMVKQLFPQVKLIENKENFGFSKGNNIAVNHAKGSYVCILNPDTVVAEDTFTKLLAFAKNKQDLGAVGCQLIDGTGTFLPESKRHIPTPKVAFKKMLGHSKAYYNSNISPNQVGETAILVGAFMLLKRDVYTAVGGFNEAYFMYGEDIDLSYKLLKAGYNNYYYGKTQVIHFKGESTTKNKTYLKRFYGAMDIFYNTHFKYNILLTFSIKLAVKLLLLKPHKKPDAIKNTKPLALVINPSETEKNCKLYCVNFKKAEQLKWYTLLFSTKDFSFKSIITFMAEHHTTNSNSYRLQLKNKTTFVGSDSNKSKGEIINT